MEKRILALLHAMLILLSVSICAFADTIPEGNQIGSLWVEIGYDGTPVAGGSLTLHKVAEITDGGFLLNSQFSGSGAELDDIQSPSVAEVLADYAVKCGYAGVTKQIDAEGVAVFPELEAALYLVVQGETASGYSPIRPFLISIPM